MYVRYFSKCDHLECVQGAVQVTAWPSQGLRNSLFPGHHRDWDSVLPYPTHVELINNEAAPYLYSFVLSVLCICIFIIFLSRVTDFEVYTIHFGSFFRESSFKITFAWWCHVMEINSGWCEECFCSLTISLKENGLSAPPPKNTADVPRRPPGFLKGRGGTNSGTWTHLPHSSGGGSTCYQTLSGILSRRGLGGPAQPLYSSTISGQSCLPSSFISRSMRPKVSFWSSVFTFCSDENTNVSPPYANSPQHHVHV